VDHLPLPVPGSAYAQGRQSREPTVITIVSTDGCTLIPHAWQAGPLNISMPTELMRRFNSVSGNSHESEYYISPSINIREPGCRLVSRRRAHVSTAAQSANPDAIFEGECEIRGAFEHGQRA